MLSDQPAAERRHPGKVPAAFGVVSPRTACPKTLSPQWPVYQSTQADWGRLRLWGSKPHREW